MGTWHMKGGSDYEDDDNPNMWFYVDIDGFDENDYENRLFSDIETDDPYMRFENAGSLASPSPKVEIGLYNGNKISITPAGISAPITVVNDIIYYVATDAEFDAAIADIDANNYSAKIILTADLTNVNATINNSSVSIEIDGLGHILDVDGDNDLLAITDCSSIIIRNCVFNISDLTTQGQSAIEIGSSAERVWIDRCVFNGDDNTIGWGVFVNGSAKRIWVTNCHFYTLYGAIFYYSATYCYAQNNYIYNTTRSIQLSNGGGYHQITNNVIITFTEYGIYFYSGTYNTISNNVVIGDGTNSLGGIYARGTGSTIIGNVVANIPSAGFAFYLRNDYLTVNDNNTFNTGYGVYLHSDCINCTVDGNTLHSAINRGIHSDATASNLTNNIITTSGDYGIVATGDYCNINGNEIYDNADDGINNTGDYCNINDNIIYSNGDFGIYCSGSGCTISENNIYNNADDGILSSGNICTISSNTVISNGDFGINLESATKCNVTGNNIYDNAGSNIRALGGYHTISGNNCNSSTNSDGIYVTGDGCTITGNNCNDNNRYGIYNRGNHTTISGNNSISNSYGIYTDDAYGSINGNVSSYNTNDGIYLTANAAYASITGNTCDYNGNYGINAVTGNIGIVGNVCDYNDRGINCAGTRTLISANKCNLNTVSHGIVSSGATATITGNECYYNVNAGIANTGSGSTITGNNCSSSTGNDGINNTANNCTISGNTCNNNNDEGIENTGSECVISDNQCSGNGDHGIYNTGIRTTINGNVCDYNDTNGITNTATGDYCVINSNICYNNTTDGINNAGDYCRIVGNQCYSNGSTNINDSSSTTIFQLEGEFDLNENGIAINTDLSGSTKYEGTILELSITSLTFGQCVYVSGNNAGSLADADASGTMPTVGIYVDDNKVLTHGVARYDSWSWTAGDRLYCGTDGNLTATAPSGSGDYIQIIAIAVNATAVMVMPSLTEVLHV